MKKEEIPALREKLTKSCDEKIAQGWRLAAGATYRKGWGDLPSLCCPLGAATEELFLAEASDALGISFRDAVRFAGGFDGGSEKSMMAELGREFRKKYIS